MADGLPAGGEHVGREAAGVGADVPPQVLHRVGDTGRPLVEDGFTQLEVGGLLGFIVMPVVQGRAAGIDAFTAIINAPQAAILAVGRIVDRVVPVSGLPSVQPMLTLSLSCDHRVVDGARGAQFLAYVAQLIEDPSKLTE